MKVIGDQILDKIHHKRPKFNTELLDEELDQGDDDEDVDEGEGEEGGDGGDGA